MDFFSESTALTLNLIFGFASLTSLILVVYLEKDRIYSCLGNLVPARSRLELEVTIFSGVLILLLTSYGMLAFVAQRSYIPDLYAQSERFQCTVTIAMLTGVLFATFCTLYILAFMVDYGDKIICYIWRSNALHRSADVLVTASVCLLAVI